MRLIDANKLKPDLTVFLSLYAEEPIKVFSQERIDNAPAIEAETVRHGRWIDTEPEYNYERHCSAHYQCSECGRRTGIRQTRTYKFCPNCGARMDGGNENGT